MANQNPNLQWNPNDVPSTNPHGPSNDGQVQAPQVRDGRHSENGFSKARGNTPMDIVNKLRRNLPERSFRE